MRSMNPAFLAVGVMTGCLLLACAAATVSVPQDKGRYVAESDAGSRNLVPRALFFGDPQRRTVRLSPDGKYLSFVAPADGVANIWVAPADNIDAAQPLTHDKGRGIYKPHFWAYSSRRIVYTADANGDENWRVHVVDIETGEDKAVTPKSAVQAQIQGVSHKHPDEILVALNDRNPKYHELYRLNLVTGTSVRAQENDRFTGFLTDDDYVVRFAVLSTPDGGSEYFTPDGSGGWKSFFIFSSQDNLNSGIFDFDAAGANAYLVSSQGRDKAALFSLNLSTMQQTMLAENPKADINNVLLHPTAKTVIAATATYDRQAWQVLDASWEADFQAIARVADGELQITGATLDLSKLLLCFFVDDGPWRYYLYDRAAKQATFLFVSDERLAGLKLSHMYPKVIPARDGLELVSYLTIPHAADRNGAVEKPLPLVLLVHGGPWHRDSWGFNSEHLWLADRGYAVLSVNFRGSTGFGKAFINAGDREWGGKMHEDLIDAVNWAVKEGVADPAKVAIMGWSYGGYATLVGLTMTPDVFACGIAGVGPANLVTFMETIPPYWIPLADIFYQRIGDPRTEEGVAFLTSRSPLTYVGDIKRPLLIGHGANDPRVNLAESQQIVTAMQEKHIPVVFALYPDEGHGFARPQNRMSFYSMAELMLGQCLGGRYAPIGDDFVGSSVTAPVGADILPGVTEALLQK